MIITYVYESWYLNCWLNAESDYSKQSDTQHTHTHTSTDAPTAIAYIMLMFGIIITSAVVNRRVERKTNG